MKTVGVLLRKYNFEKSFGYYGVNVHVLGALRKYPVKVVGIMVDNELDETIDVIKDLVDECDGIILTGGHTHSLIDYDLIKYLHEIDKPTFGICLGMQHMGKLFNGKIIEKIENHNGHDYYAHKVNVVEKSLLHSIIGESEIMVNTLHSYHLPNNINYDPLVISARSEDGFIEAIEDKNKKFFLGVQWHPESLLSIDDVNSKKLFDYFISKL